LQTTPSIPFCCTLISILLLGVIFVKSGKVNSDIFGILAASTTLSIGFLAVTMAQPKNHHDHYSSISDSGSHLYLLQIQEVLKSNTFSDNYIASVIKIDHKRSSGKIFLSSKIDALGPKLKPDQHITYYGSYSATDNPLNPHQFSYKNYLNTLGIYDRMQLEPDRIEIKNKSLTTPYGWAFKIREYITEKLKKAQIGRKELSIIQTLLLGQRTDIS
jgi:competence protein ComEC